MGLTEDVLIDGIMMKAEDLASDLQPWANYYKLRAKEMEALFSLYRPASHGRALDMGSGIGFNALILDSIYDKTIAADLHSSDNRTHSLGMDRQRRFLDRMPHKNIDIVSARCEYLPFEDESFDTVFMIYTLEHVKERLAALKEARRVIRQKGEVVIIVPGFLERLLYPFSFYRDIAAKAFGYLLSRKGAVTGDGKTAVKTRAEKRSFGRKFFSAYPHFPFPDPHGEYQDYFCELAGSVSLFWYRLARKSGLEVNGSFTTMVFPKEFSSFFLGGKALEYYIRTLWLNRKFGKSALFKHFGQNLCLVLGRYD